MLFHVNMLFRKNLKKEENPNLSKLVLSKNYFMTVGNELIFKTKPLPNFEVCIRLRNSIDVNLCNTPKDYDYKIIFELRDE